MSDEILVAHVENGRYVVETPTDLPDGCVVSLKVVSESLMSAEERARLNAALDASLAEIDAGGAGMDMADFLLELRAEP